MHWRDEDPIEAEERVLFSSGNITGRTCAHSGCIFTKPVVLLSVTEESRLVASTPSFMTRTCGSSPEPNF